MAKKDIHKMAATLYDEVRKYRAWLPEASEVFVTQEVQTLSESVDDVNVTLVLKIKTKDED